MFSTNLYFELFNVIKYYKIKRINEIFDNVYYVSKCLLSN